MAVARRRLGRLMIELALAGLAFSGLVVGLCGLHVSRAEVDVEAADDEARQLTLFGVIATPGGKTADTNLATIKTQLDKLLPRHGFKLLDAQSKRIVAGESVTCDLRNGHSLVASLVKPVDENGKVQIRCELFSRPSIRDFSTVVKTPPNPALFLRAATPMTERNY